MTECELAEQKKQKSKKSNELRKCQHTVFFLSHPTPIFGTQLLFLLLGLALSGESIPKRDMDGPFFFLGKDHV